MQEKVLMSIKSKGSLWYEKLSKNWPYVLLALILLFGVFLTDTGIVRFELTSSFYELLTVFISGFFGLIFIINGVSHLRREFLSGFYELYGGFVALVIVPFLYLIFSNTPAYPNLWVITGSAAFSSGILAPLADYGTSTWKQKVSIWHGVVAGVMLGTVPVILMSVITIDGNVLPFHAIYQLSSSLILSLGFFASKYEDFRVKTQAT